MSEKRPISIEDLYRMIAVEDVQISPDGKWLAFVKVAIDRVENGYERNIWLVSTDGGAPFQLTRSGKDSQPRWSPDGSSLAFVSSRGDRSQIFVLPVTAPGGEARSLTSASNGAHSPDWSPDGQHIAYLAPVNAEERAREDTGYTEESPKDKLESKHRKERREEDEKGRGDPYYMWRVPYRVGTSLVGDRFLQVYVVPTDPNLEGDAAKPRRLTDLDANYAPPRWAADGQSLYSARQIDIHGNEPFMDSGLFRLDMDSGGEAAIEIPGWSCFSPSPSPDGKWIAFDRLPNDKRGSLMESIDRLSIISTEDGTVRDLNVELDRSVGAHEWTADSRGIVFSAETEGIAPIYLASVENYAVSKLADGNFKSLWLDTGIDGSVAFVASTPGSPSEVFWLSGNDEKDRQLTRFNESFLDEVYVQPTHEMWFTTPAGHRIQGWYMLPVGYEEGKQYPLALHIHGGPHVMWGPSQETMFHEWQTHAGQGYAVFYCNPRGAAGYGEAFQKALHGGWGDVAYDDIMAGVDALLEQGFVDESKMAVTGGSYGGYMTAWVVSHTNRFQCAVSQRGVYNLISFTGTSDVPSLIFGEYDAFPWENHELLWQHSPVAYAHQIKTPLLIIHSENDYRVPIEQAEQLFAFVRYSGGTVEMWRYPREGHELSRSGEPEHRVSRLQKMMDWFDRYCKPAE